MCLYPELVKDETLPLDVRSRAQKFVEACDGESLGKDLCGIHYLFLINLPSPRPDLCVDRVFIASSFTGEKNCFTTSPHHRAAPSVGSKSKTTAESSSVCPTHTKFYCEQDRDMKVQMSRDSFCDHNPGCFAHSAHLLL